jgi:hypothetical protein
MNPSVLALTRVLHQVAESEILAQSDEGGDGAFDRSLEARSWTETAKDFARTEETTNVQRA